MTGRIHSIDAVRGFCLLNIFVNHITLGFFKELSFSKVGLSDSSEIFVLISGISTYIFYGKMQLRSMILMFLLRFTKLYYFGIIVVVTTVTLVLFVDFLNGDLNVLNKGAVDAVYGNGGISSILSMFNFQNKIGYSAILALYAYLMLFGPILVGLAAKMWWYSLLPAAFIWVVVGHFGLVLPNDSIDEPFVLTVLPWTLTFACGVALGAAIKQGVRVPQSRLLKGLALAYVLGYVIFIALIAPRWPAGMDWLIARDDHFWLGGSKTYQSPLRLLHVLALAYLLISCPDAPLIRLLRRADPRNVLCRLGRRSLPVFVFGAIVSTAANEALYAAHHFFGAKSLPSIAVELVFVALGIAVMIAIADRRGPFQRPNRVVAEQPISP
jgi:hypothetical protein